ncbi:MAG TPA: DUF3617 domain-containing protein [Vicinamibacterales bacterium]|nr:DUF3617 domain-containing protein [Vicinamibacterales bacterium]
MKIVLAALVLAALPFATQAETLDIKTGAWEITTKTLIAGMQIPQEAMANMPAAQRARIEEAMRARAGKVNTTTYQSCVTQQDLDRGNLGNSEQKNCTRKVVTQSARHLELEETCGAPEPSAGHFKVDTTSPENFTGVFDMTPNQGTKVHVEMSGRWLGATCKEGADD